MPGLRHRPFRFPVGADLDWKSQTRAVLNGVRRVDVSISGMRPGPKLVIQYVY